MSEQQRDTIHAYHSVATLQHMTRDENERHVYPCYITVDLQIYLEGVYEHINAYVSNGMIMVPRTLEHAADVEWKLFLSPMGLTDIEWKNCKKFLEDEGFHIIDKKSHLIICWMADDEKIHNKDNIESNNV